MSTTRCVDGEDAAVSGADPNCFCNVVHLPFSALRDTGWGHCLCACHGPGEHVRDAPCRCNSTRGQEREWRNS